MMLMRNAAKGRMAGPAAGGGGSGLLLTLNPALASNPAYEYWNSATDGGNYLGAFVTSDGQVHGDTQGASVSLQVIGEGSQAGRLFMTGYGGTAIAEIAIPALVTGTNPAALNIATMTQNYRNATSVQAWDQGPPIYQAGGFDIPRINGISTFNGQVIIGACGVYDNNNIPENMQVYRDATAIASSAQSPMFRITGGRHHAGWLVDIPAEFQDEFGGTHLYGFGGGLSIASSQGLGVCMGVVDAQDILDATSASEVVTGTLVTDFSEATPMSDYFGALEWNPLTRAVCFFFVPNTRTIMAVGSNWAGETPLIYHETNDQGYFYPGHGPQDGYDYQNEYFLFDIDDVLAAKAGSIALNAVRPYEQGALPLYPFCAPYLGLNLIGGGWFDNSTKRLYFTIQAGRQIDEFTPVPTIGVLDFSGVGA